VPTHKELKALAKVRLKEADILLTAGYYDGAAYLCGYVVEMALKARICKHLGVVDYPDSGKLARVYAVHDLDQLLLLSGLKPKVDPTQPIFVTWSVAVPWRPERRYSPIGTFSAQDAADILDAIRNPPDGVFPWIKRHW
jgi:hypothetical protein